MSNNWCDMNNSSGKLASSFDFSVDHNSYCIVPSPHIMKVLMKKYLLKQNFFNALSNNSISDLFTNV